MITRSFGRGGPPVPVIGQGTWRMGEDSRVRDREVAALRLGLELGLTHIDTAEMYADGRAEEIVGEAIADRRAEVLVTTKVRPTGASYDGTLRAFEASLKRLRTSYIDLATAPLVSARRRASPPFRNLPPGLGLRRQSRRSNRAKSSRLVVSREES